MAGDSPGESPRVPEWRGRPRKGLNKWLANNRGSAMTEDPRRQATPGKLRRAQSKTKAGKPRPRQSTDGHD